MVKDNVFRTHCLVLRRFKSDLYHDRLTERLRCWSAKPVFLGSTPRSVIHMAALAEWFRYRSVEPGTRVRVPYVALLYGKIGVMVAYDYG